MITCEDLILSPMELAHRPRPYWMRPDTYPAGHTHRKNYIDNVRLLLAAVEQLPENMIWCGQVPQAFPPRYAQALTLAQIACTLPALNARGLYWDRYNGAWGPWAYWIADTVTTCEFQNMVLREFFDSYGDTEGECRIGRQCDPGIYLFACYSAGAQGWTANDLGIGGNDGKAFTIAKLRKAIACQEAARTP